MDLLDENADSVETMSSVAELVAETLQCASQQWYILVGDGKQYEHLQQTKRLYGDTLKKLLIFPGDWHILKNFQQVIMKAYYHTGLQEIASHSTYKSETLASLHKCSNFKRTHTFLLQVWEALFLEMISSFLSSNPQFIALKDTIKTTYENNETTPVQYLLSIKRLVSETLAEDAFTNFVKQQSDLDNTWKLWANFVFRDVFCYI
jgi:hypothetical protein